jgi:hypothetical protein
LGVPEAVDTVRSSAPYFRRSCFKREMVMLGVFFAAMAGGIVGGVIITLLLDWARREKRIARSDFQTRLARIQGVYLANFSKDQCFELARSLWPHGSEAEILLLTNTLASRSCRGNGSMEDVYRAWHGLSRGYPKA